MGIEAFKAIIGMIVCLIALPFIIVLVFFAAMWFSKLVEIFIEFLDEHLPNN